MKDIVGVRYHRRDEGFYDLCQAHFNELPHDEQREFDAIDRAAPLRCGACDFLRNHRLSLWLLCHGLVLVGCGCSAMASCWYAGPVLKASVLAALIAGRLSDSPIAAVKFGKG